MDAGIVEQGTPIQAELIVHNNRPTSLAITDIVKSCGCTRATISPSVISAGSIAHLTVAIDTGGRSGQFRSNATILGGEKREVLLPITFSGVVETQSSIVVTPHRIDFGTVEVTSTPVRECILTSRSRPGSALQRVKDVPKQGNAGTLLEVISIKPTVLVDDTVGEATKIRLTLPANKTIGTFTDQITLRASGGGHNTEIQIAVVAEVVGAFRVSPRSIFLDRITPGIGAKRRVVLTGTPEGLQGLKITSSAEWCRVGPLYNEESTTSAWFDLCVLTEASGVFQTAVQLVTDRLSTEMKVTVYATQD